MWFQKGGVALALVAGAMNLWVTFIPCFLWIFAGAPYVEALLARPRLKGALRAISVVVVGVILNLSVWFALHVLFATVIDSTFGPRPEWGSVIWLSVGFVALAAGLLIGLGWSVVRVLAVMAALAGGLYLVG